MVKNDGGKFAHAGGVYGKGDTNLNMHDLCCKPCKYTAEIIIYVHSCTCISTVWCYTSSQGHDQYTWKY